MNNNKTLDTKELVIKDAINQFVFHCKYEKKLDIKTINAYKTDLKQFKLFIKNHFQEDNINNITKENLKLYIQSISQFKPKTTKRKLASVKAMFNFLDFENDDFTNLFHKMRIKIKEPKILPIVMNLDEVSKILGLIYNEYYSENNSIYKRNSTIRNIAIIELLFSTGIRVSELCNLKCTNIDFTNEQIKVFGKGNKERVIHICQKSVWNILKLYNSIFKPETYFFINRLGKKTSSQSVRLLVKKYVRLSKINKKITPHTFRHTFATLLLEENVDIKYIQNLLGHSSILTTQIYTHVSSKKQKDILSNKHPRLKLNFNC